MNRRHFLRGMGAWHRSPAFGSLLPSRLFAATAAVNSPRRRPVHLAHRFRFLSERGDPVALVPEGGSPISV